MTTHLIETFEDGIATLTFNRPEARNALTGELIQALSAAAPRLALDPKVRVVVITGAGGAFCAGGDVKGFVAPKAEGAAAPTFDERVHAIRAGADFSRMLHEMPKPTLAVIPGAAAGAGLSIALACDMRIAADNAKLTTAFSKIGASGDYGGSYFLTHLVGPAKARELYFTADVITGAEAAQLGIVNRAVPAQDLALIIFDDGDAVEENRLDRGLPWPQAQGIVAERRIIGIQDKRGTAVGMPGEIGMEHGFWTLPPLLSGWRATAFLK